MKADVAAANGGAAGTASPTAAASTDGNSPAATTDATPSPAGTPPTQPVAGGAGTTSATSGAEVHKPSASGTSTPTSLSTHDASATGKGGKASSSKHSNKLTAEQRKQMDDLAAERRKNEIERITVLTNKLKDRIRPYTQATLNNTSNLDMQKEETQRWENRIKEEIEDLKGESFGLELCRLIGQIVSLSRSDPRPIRMPPMSSLSMARPRSLLLPFNRSHIILFAKEEVMLQDNR